MNLPIVLRTVAAVLLTTSAGVHARLLGWHRNDARAWNPAPETTAVDHAGWNPRPTPGADPVVALARRDQLTGEQTCGINTRQKIPFNLVCSETYTCHALSNGKTSLIACCDTEICPEIYTRCENYQTTVRRVTEGVLYCTDRSSPSCATLVGTGATYLGYSYFGCATHSGALPIDWVLDRTVAPPSSSERTAIETETITTGPGARDTITSPTNADPSSITSTEAAAPNTPAGGGDIDASPNNGALIGGVVGGIVFLAVSILGVIFAVRRYRKDQRADSPPPTPTTVHDDPHMFNEKPQHIYPGQEPTIPYAEDIQPVPTPGPFYLNETHSTHSYDKSMVSPPTSPPPCQTSFLSPPSGPVSVIYPESAAPQTAVAVRYKAYTPPVASADASGVIRPGTPIPELPISELPDNSREIQELA